MEEKERLEKNNRIRQTLIETRQRRVNQRCLVYELKINTSKLSKSDYNKLKGFFVECKWLYNYLLNLELKDWNTVKRNIYSYDKDKNKIERTLTIPAKMIQDVRNILKQNLMQMHEEWLLLYA